MRIYIRRIFRATHTPDSNEVKFRPKNGATAPRVHEWPRIPAIDIAMGEKAAGCLLDGRVHDEFPRAGLA